MKQVVPWGWFKRKSDKAKCDWVCRGLGLTKDICTLLQMHVYVCVSDVVFERLFKKQTTHDSQMLLLEVYDILCQEKSYRMSGFTFGFAQRTKRFLVSSFATLFAECGVDVCMMVYSIHPEFIIPDVKELALSNTTNSFCAFLYFEEKKSTVYLQDSRGEFPAFTKITLCITWDANQLLFNIQP
jgi:hypothetical protein